MLPDAFFAGWEGAWRCVVRLIWCRKKGWQGSREKKGGNANSSGMPLRTGVPAARRLRCVLPVSHAFDVNIVFLHARGNCCSRELKTRMAARLQAAGKPIKVGIQ
jgi:hypothetical protein